MSMNEVLIVGGGIGGLCAALALQQRGMACRVFESVKEVRAVGAGIIVAPNVMNVLARLGLADAVRACGIELDSLLLTDEQGRPLLATPQRDELIRDYGYTLVGLLHSELYGVLLRHLPDGTVITGKTLVRFEENADGVVAHFDDGTYETGRILIGAEMIHSVVRQQMLPNIAPRYSGQTSYRGVANFSLVASGHALAREAWGSKIRLGVVAVSSTQTYWYATLPAPAGTEDPSKAAAKLHLITWAREFAHPGAAVIEATPEARFIRTDMYDLTPLPSWHNGRVVLLGDAAHAATPNLGQGGNQAIEDAWVIASAISQHSACNDYAQAFADYERIRKPKAEMIVARSRQLGGMVHLPQPWQRALRNTITFAGLYGGSR
jgi:2-polyprenyl-6-methoxyphenol hydroxylase-like FAD-dependent oxidoreductase